MSAAQPLVVVAARRGQMDLWLTADDRWTPCLREAELLSDEAHAQLRLIEALQGGDDLADIRLAAIRRSATLAMVA